MMTSGISFWSDLFKDLKNDFQIRDVNEKGHLIPYQAFLFLISKRS